MFASAHPTGHYREIALKKGLRAWVAAWLTLAGFVGMSGSALAGGTTGKVTKFDGAPILNLNSGPQTNALVSAESGASNPLASSAIFLHQESVKLRSTLFEDIGSSATWASDAWWHSGDIEKRYNAALLNYSIRNGYYATSQDSPRSARPRHFSAEQEILFRHEMARSMRHYMIERGIPNFLKSREETRKLGEKYESTRQAIASVASVNVVTENKWNFRTGANPLNMKAWMAYTNAQWNFEINSHMTSLGYDIFAQRAFKRGYSSEIRYRSNGRYFLAEVIKTYSPSLRGYVANQVPVTDPMVGMSNRVGFDYSF